MAGGARPYLLKTGPDGRRHASWRVWVLIWVTPVVFAGAVAVLALMAWQARATMVETDGVVTHVYAWKNDAPQIFYPGDRIYSPRFRYTWTDGTETEATTGGSHTGWGFEIGSTHRIRYDPDEKADVVIAGPSEWWLVQIIAVLTIISAIPALLATFLLRAWLRRGAS